MKPTAASDRALAVDFRKGFLVGNPAELAGLEMESRFDDGAMFYSRGNFRFGMRRVKF